jgi:hypothetical protein
MGGANHASPPERAGPAVAGPEFVMTRLSRSRWVILRDLAIFQARLAMDGLKDLVFMPISIAAAALDVVFPGKRPGHRFYFVLRIGERFDSWLSLFGAAEKADALDDGLFGVSRAGSRTLLGRLEEFVIGHAEPEPERDPSRHPA